MPTSPDGILEAVFDPAWATVRLIVDGGMWPSAVDRITVTRVSAVEDQIPVRGVQSRAVIGGYFVGSDPECPLGVDVTYTVTGSLGTAVVATAAVTVSTTGAADGLWVKVPGLPDLACRVRLRDIDDVVSDTIGGVYTIAGGGGSVVQTTAQWSGISADRTSVMVSAATGAELACLRAALAAGRVLLLQPVGSSDLDPGWYFVSSVSRSNPAGIESYGRRWVTLNVQRTGVPAGDGQGVPGVTWAALQARYDTWADVLAGAPTWFDVMQGA